jgi:signal transduction histidine kinase
MATARSDDASTQFAREIVDVNLRRIPWLLVASMLLALWPIIALWHDASMAWLRWVLIVDLLSAGLFLVLNRRIRHLPASSPWRSLYVWTVIVLALVYMDGYYFLVGGSFGQNPVYILGVIMVATIFLLPPRHFLPLLVANHLVYCVLLVAAATGDGLLPILVQNTTGATVAGLVSILLYRARREEFLQRQALAAANRDLARKNAQLNEVMAITAHDLRSPLLGMRDLLVLAGRSAPSPRLGELLGHVSRSCSGLVALVNRLLDAHAAEEGAQQPLALESCDVRDLVRQAAERIRPRADTRSIAVVLDLPDEPVELAVNAAALEQVLDNLLSNAVRFSPSDTSVIVRLAQLAGRWFCEVADQGPGIPATERAMLFQKFHRGSNRPVEDEASSGLGLFIAANLMQSMGGEVTYQPGEACGSLFRITFGSAPVPAGQRVPS